MCFLEKQLSQQEQLETTAATQASPLFPLGCAAASPSIIHTVTSTLFLLVLLRPKPPRAFILWENKAQTGSSLSCLS